MTNNPLRRVFQNLSVKGQLLSGFGIVLLLMLAMIMTTMVGNQNTVDRVTKADDANRIVKWFQEARIAEKNFLNRRNEEELEVGRERLEQIRELAIELQGQFNQVQNQENVDALLVAVDRYEEQVNQLVNLFNTRESASQEMREAARIVQEQASEFRTSKKEDLLSLLDQSDASSESINQDLNVADGANRLIRSMLQIRRDEKNYEIYRDERYAEDVHSAADQMRDEMFGLYNMRLSLDQQGVLANIEESLNDYEDVFSRIETITEQDREVDQQLVAAGREVLRLAEELRDSQKAQMESILATSERTGVGVGVAGLLIGILAALGINRLIVPRLKEAEQLASTVAGGDLTHQIDSSGSDEVGRLMTSLSVMVEKLKSTIGKISGSAEQVATSSEELAVVTNETAEQINSQNEEIDQVATALHEMTSSIQEVAANAENTSEAAEEASTNAEKGRAMVSETNEAIGALSADITESQHSIQSLKDHTESVTTVLDVIKGIAEQTNLLALNAAIEAARAGEHGRGFAVVADEVRSLSIRTQDSTGEIEGLIEKLQNGADASVSAMESNVERANLASERSTEAMKALETIAAAVDRVAEMNVQIASAATEQGSVSEEISASVQRIKDLAEQTQSGGEQTSAAGKDLAQLSQDLNQITSEFKL